MILNYILFIAALFFLKVNIELFYAIVIVYYIFWILTYQNKNSNIKIYIGLVLIGFIFEYIFHSNLVNYLYEIDKSLIFRYENNLFAIKEIFFFFCLLFLNNSFNLKYSNYMVLFFLTFYLNDIYIVLGYILFLFSSQYKVIFKFIKIEYKNILLVLGIWVFVLALYYNNFFVNIIKYLFGFKYIFLLFILGMIFYINNVLYILFIEFIFFLSLLFEQPHFDYLYYLMQLMAATYSFYFVFNYQKYIHIVKSNRIVLTLLGIIGTIFISYLVSIYLFGSTPYSSWYFTNSRYFLNHFLLFFVLLLIFITYMPKKYYKYVLYAFLLAVFISEIFSYLVYFNLIDIEFFKQLEILYYKTKSCDPAPFTNHIHYSTFVAISLIILLYKIDVETNKLKYVYIFVFLIEFLNLFINGGRAGQLMIFISIIIYIIYYKKHMIRNLFLFILGVFILFNFHTKCNNNKRLLKGINSIHKVYSENYYRTSWGQRLAINLTAIDYLTQDACKFVCGSGASRDKIEWKKHLLEMPKNISEPIAHIYIHSSIFQMWFDGGIFAIILWLYLIYLLFKISTNPAMYSLTFVIIIYSIQDQILMGLDTASQYSLFLVVLIFIHIFKERQEIVFNSNPHIQQSK